MQKSRDVVCFVAGLPDGLDQLPPRKSLFTDTQTVIIEQKLMIELKMLAIFSATNFNDLQKHIFLFSILDSF